MSNSLDPDQARQIVEPDQGPNCLQSNQQSTLAGNELKISGLIHMACGAPKTKLNLPLNSNFPVTLA